MTTALKIFFIDLWPPAKAVLLPSRSLLFSWAKESYLPVEQGKAARAQSVRQDFVPHPARPVLVPRQQIWPPRRSAPPEPRLPFSRPPACRARHDGLPCLRVLPLRSSVPAVPYPDGPPSLRTYRGWP